VGSLKEDLTVVVVSYSGKEINAKLVYYGAGLCGKTTNLESIYEAVPDTSRGKMVSMKTQSDRTLFFDLLPLDLGEIMGFKTRFLLYTVPGQVFYNATRKLVLKGADAIVFVADSEVGKMEENKESLANLRANLAEYNLNLDQIPWVIQYNKRDLPNIYTLDELNAELNLGGKVPFFEAVATEGKGVFETFRGISHLLMEKVTKDLRRSPSSATTSRPAAVEEPPPPPVSKSPHAPATPLAPPARSIHREAMATPELAGEASGVDYGREIELPDTIPPATRGRTPTHQPSAAPAATAAKPQRRSTDVAPEAPATQRIPTGPSRASAAPGADANGATIVVPVQIPRGASREIVLKIVITTED
jgi:signal recognition particle receptor subunit beta